MKYIKQETLCLQQKRRLDHMWSINGVTLLQGHKHLETLLLLKAEVKNVLELERAKA